VRDRLGEHTGPEEGGLTGPNPVERGKHGSKIHLVTSHPAVALAAAGPAGFAPNEMDYRSEEHGAAITPCTHGRT